MKYEIVYCALDSHQDMKNVGAFLAIVQFVALGSW